MSKQEQQHEHGDKKSANRERIILGSIIIAGVALVALLLSPFILEMLGGRRSADAPTLSDEQIAGDKPIGSSRRKKFQSWRPIYDNFGGIKLGATNDELHQKFPLHLKGKPDAVPVLYESTNQNQAVKLHAEFYQDRLKDFTIVFGPFRDGPEQLRDHLYKGLDEGPRYRIGDANAGVRIGMQDPDLVKFLSVFQQAQAYTWGDGSNRLDATVYSTVTASNQSVCALAVRVTAVTWIEDYKLKATAESAVRLREKSKPSESATPSDAGPGPSR